MDEHKKAVCEQAEEESKMFSKGNPGVMVIYIDDTIGYSCFAGQDFKEGDLVGEATGVVKIGHPAIGDDDYAYPFGNRLSSDYVTKALQSKGAIPKQDWIYISGREQGSELRCICHRNSNGGKLKYVYSDGAKPVVNCLVAWGFYGGAFRLLITAKRDIKEGEELLLDYGHVIHGFIETVHFYDKKKSKVIPLKKS